MHIEFKLPRSQRIRYKMYIIERIEEWLEKNSISDYDIRTNVNDNHTLAFTLSKKELYTLFLLAWNDTTITPTLKEF